MPTKLLVSERIRLRHVVHEYWRVCGGIPGIAHEFFFMPRHVAPVSGRPKRLAARSRASHVKEQRTAGHRRACVRCANWAASRRPAYAATILRPMPCALPLFPPRSNARQIRPGPSSPGRQRVRTPEAGPLSGARLRRAGFRPPVVRAHLRRRDPSPEKQTVCSSRPHGRGMHAV